VQAVECPECRQAVAGRVVLFGALANVKASLAAGGAMADCGVTQPRRGEIVESLGPFLREGACRATGWAFMS
jgi:hypothetical protein